MEVCEKSKVLQLCGPVKLRGVMKKAVKWTSTDVDTSSTVDSFYRRSVGKEQSGQRPPRKRSVIHISHLRSTSTNAIDVYREKCSGRRRPLHFLGRWKAALFITPVIESKTKVYLGSLSQFTALSWKQKKKICCPVYFML